MSWNVRAAVYNPPSPPAWPPAVSMGLSLGSQGLGPVASLLCAAAPSPVSDCHGAKTQKNARRDGFAETAHRKYSTCPHSITSEDAEALKTSKKRPKIKNTISRDSSECSQKTLHGLDINRQWSLANHTHTRKGKRRQSTDQKWPFCDMVMYGSVDKITPPIRQELERSPDSQTS